MAQMVYTVGNTITLEINTYRQIGCKIITGLTRTGTPPPKNVTNPINISINILFVTIPRNILSSLYVLPLIHNILCFFLWLAKDEYILIF